jgi:hypothetical protein
MQLAVTTNHHLGFKTSNAERMRIDKDGYVSVTKSIKLGDDTRTADVAGAGTLRWNGGVLQNSDGTDWFDVGGSAPLALSWVLQQGGCESGLLSTDGLVWNSEIGATHSYSGVVLNHTFTGDFEVIASWAHDYMGCAFAYKDGADWNDYFTYGQNCQNSYMGGLSTSGFDGGGYSVWGQYHAPILGNGQYSTVTWFKLSRVGNVLYRQYSFSSATGPWSDFSGDGAALTIPSSNSVVVGFGEASGTENDPLRLISVTGS